MLPTTDTLLAAQPNRRLWPLGRPARVWILVGALWVAAAVVTQELLHALHAPGGPAVPWWALAIVFYLAEANVIHVHFRREAHSLSLSEIPLVIGLYFTAPDQIVLATVVGSAAALLVHRRQPRVKLAFNLGAFAVNTSVAILVFQAVMGGAANGPRAWAAGFIAVAAEAITGVLLVTLAIYLAEGSNTLSGVPRIAAVAVTGAVAVASLAMLGASEVRDSHLVVLVLLAPATIATVVAYRAYGKQRRRHEHLTHLYETMQATQAAPDADGAVRELLESARRIFRADVAELLLARPAGRDLRSTVSPRGTWLMQAAELDDCECGALSAIRSSGKVALFERSTPRRARHQYLRARGFKDAMVAPLRRDADIVGVLVVADRSSDVTTFQADDQQLFEAFAAHAAVLLENDRLVQSVASLTELKEQLRHQAHHDSLTGLANRRLILELAALALEARQDTTTGPAFLFVDLDDFKTINDSLGHSAGDELLTAVGDRLGQTIGEEGIAARLGGDEFAVLLRDVSPAEARKLAMRIARRFAEPFQVGPEAVNTHATIGIALSGSDVVDAEDLLRNADLAMYNAKRKGKQRYAVYRPDMRLQVMQRHELVAALERAVENDEFVVHYQPLVDLTTGRLKAFEALVRWECPGRGTVEPEEFLRLAEETGLIIPIGRTVLDTAVAQLCTWRLEHGLPPDVAMAVNVSAREFHDPSLPGQVASLIRRASVAPDNLILELTESSAVTDLEATLSTMRQLRSIGVQLALDDFGTGHSSLGRLSELPINLIKIGKPFTDDLSSEEAPYARAVFNFASSLPLRVVAEGIETSEQLDSLREFCCDWGQGYLFARPLSAEDADAFVLRAFGRHLRACQAA